MRCRFDVAVFALVGFLAPQWARGELQLLMSFDDREAGASVPEPEEHVQIVLRHGSPVPPYDISLGVGIWWEDGDAGIVDFSPASHADYPLFAERVTDGIDEMLYISILGSRGGSGHGWPESSFFDTETDLVGNQLELIRLIVHDVQITPYVVPDIGVGIQYTVEMTYEFWGQPIPEPATSLLLLLGAYALLRRSGPNTPRT